MHHGNRLEPTAANFGRGWVEMTPCDPNLRKVTVEDIEKCAARVAELARYVTGPASNARHGTDAMPTIERVLGMRHESTHRIRQAVWRDQDWARTMARDTWPGEPSYADELQRLEQLKSGAYVVKG